MDITKEYTLQTENVELETCERILEYYQCNEWYSRGLQKLSDLDSLTIFIGGGVFWNSRIWTLWQFSFGGYSETLWQFSLGGGILNFRIGGILSEFGPKFQPLQQAHASQIVSHILRMWRLITKMLIILPFYVRKVLIPINLSFVK